MKHRLLLIFLFFSILISFESVYAENKDLSLKKIDKPDLNYTDYNRKVEITKFFDIFWQDVKYTFSTLSKFDRKKLKTISPFIVITGAAFVFDGELWKILLRDQSNLRNQRDDFLEGFEKLGDGLVILSGTVLGYTGGALFYSEKTKETAMMATEAFFLSGIFTSFSKGIVSRQRPNPDKIEAFKFYGPRLSIEHSRVSFPSGHTGSIFSVATVIAEQYNNNIYIKTIAYTLATMVGIQRVNRGYHWLSDVIAGGALGYWVGKSIVRSHNNKYSSLSIAPLVVPKNRYLGVRLGYKF